MHPLKSYTLLNPCESRTTERFGKAGRSMRVLIRIQGYLDKSWQEWFEGLQIVHEEQGTTLLSGPLSDQAALYGVLLKIRNLGLTLLSFESDKQQMLSGDEMTSGKDTAG